MRFIVPPRRLVAASVAVATAAVLTHSAVGASPVPTPPALTDVACDAGSMPEATQGRVPAADYSTGRAAQGYTCNTQAVGHYGKTGGFKVLRYVDNAGHVCAYYDSTLLFPKDAVTNAEGPGVFVLDMTDPTKPALTDTLKTPAMLSPHESLLLNQERGLLVADMGYPTFNPGFVDVYSLSDDCRHPVLDSSAPMGILGHESAFSPDGKTFYVSSTGGQTLTAVDLTDPTKPSILFTEFGVDYHGMRVSDDGNRLYVADIGGDNTGYGGSAGLTILDVSQIQQRVPNPKVTTVSHLTWPTVSIPQVPIPMTIGGHRYLLEVDEYTAHTVGQQALQYDPNDPVGAARIINIDDDTHPYVVSDLRLAVNQPENRAGDQKNDPGAQFAAQGYAGHYCSVPREVDPGIVACSFIVSGERFINVQDPAHPYEVGYFNKPATTGYPTGGYAMSQAAWDLTAHDVWYTDGSTGLWVVHLSDTVWPAGL
ncbi:MAG TPA: hypothetical protein VFH66_02735 [Mycobacteriales bacterium]|nr:hypothetical protein [Mycobacteriales bacterium]